MRKTEKAFTLLELIVAMAVIAVLMGLSLYGIQTLQRNQRDTERRSAVSNINLEITSYYSDFGSYPTSLTLQVATKTATIGSGATARIVPLKGAAVPLASVGNPVSTNSGSIYCYSSTSGSSYAIGVNLEGTGWAPGFQLSSSAGVTCGATSIITAS